MNSILKSRRGRAVSSQTSQASSMLSRSSVNSSLTAVLEEKLCVDEYGYTDKLCKRCSTKLSIEEVMASVVPLDEEFST